MSKPIGDRVLVELAPAETSKTASGIIIPAVTKGKPLHGTVLAVGDGLKDEPMRIAVGDVVYFEQESGTKIDVDGKACVVVHQMDILLKK